MRTPWRWLDFSTVVAIAILAAPLSVYGACSPAGTPGDDTIVCKGTDDVGVSSGDGDDKITVRPHAAVSRTDRQETYRAPAEATAVTLDAGAGQNSIRNRGTVAANAVAVSQEDAPRAQATALAISAGIPWLGGGGTRHGILRDVIDNAGIIAVTADSAATVNIRSMPGNTTGASAADATGIRTGQAGADVTNTGSLGVLAQARTHLNGVPDTTSESAQASTVATAAATAMGISAAGGDNHVRNDGTIRVEAVIRDAFARADSWSSSGDSTSFAETQATATATGITTGLGNDDIKNDGRLTVVADADAVAEARADAPAGASAFEMAKVAATARAIGIDAGAGGNVIRNAGTLNVRAMATARATTFEGIGGFSAAFGGTATGIKVGDGGSDIRNTGTIDVLAAASAHGATNAVAVGILGGDGDDTIVNAGTIFTGVVDSPDVLRTLVLADQPGTTITTGIRQGIAITTGAGNDTVTLAAGSQTVGAIDLGAGDDRLTISGKAVVSGPIDAGAGIDTLVLDGAGSLGGTPVAFESAVKQGRGTYALPGLAPLQHLAVKEGTLRLNSSYTFAPSGTFQAAVYGDGSHGQLSVAGTATLGGALQILRGSSPYRNGTRYDVVTADTLTGWFSSIALPTSTPLVSFRVNAPRDHVEIEAIVQRFATVATNATQHRIAQHLDTLSSEATGDLATVLLEVQLLPAAGFDRAFASLSPTSYGSTTQATFEGVGQYTQSLQGRLEAVRAASRTEGGETPGTPVLLAAAAADASLIPILGTYRLSQTQATQGLWLNGFGQWADQEAGPGFSGFTASTGGATVGYDHTFADKLTAGLSLGYSNTDLDLADNQGGGRIQSLFTSLYGSYFTSTVHVDAALSYGHNWYKNDRRLVIGAVERTATSDHAGDAFAAYLGAGYSHPLGTWGVGPVGALRYVYLAEEGFQETGADSLNLTVNSRGTHSLVSELGLRVTGAVKASAGSLVPDLSVLWSYDFDVDDRTITTTYAGAPGTAFSVQGQPVARHGLLVRPGLTFVHRSGLSTALRYAGEFRDRYQSHGVLGEVRLEF
jgi:subtilase-type serine protease